MWRRNGNEKMGCGRWSVLGGKGRWGTKTFGWEVWPYSYMKCGFVELYTEMKGTKP